MTPETTFREVQRYRRPDGWLLAAGVTLLLAALAVETGSAVLGVGTALAGLSLFGGLATLRLTVELRPAGLYVQYRPFHRSRLIRYETLRAVERRRYRPATRLGRWGLRLGLAEPTYNIAGDDGVLIRYGTEEGDERELVVGSERADELVAALRAAGRRAGGRVRRDGSTSGTGRTGGRREGSGGNGGSAGTGVPRPDGGVSPPTSDGSRRPG